MEESIKYKQGDTGPAGGMVFIIDKENRFMEAAAVDLGPVPGYEAEKLCKEYRGGGLDDWYLPNNEELRSFAVALYHLPGSSAFNVKYENKPVIHWSSDVRDGKRTAVCTREHYDTYNPYYQRPASANGPYLGNVVETDESTCLPVRPVREIKG